jgi:hypothetical protein
VRRRATRGDRNVGIWHDDGGEPRPRRRVPPIAA